MKINNLMTLSQFIDEMGDYTHESHDYERACKKIIIYNEFLKQPLKKEMFVNELSKPPHIFSDHHDSSKSFMYQNSEGFLKWQQAEKKVIFKNIHFEFIENGIVINNGSIINSNRDLIIAGLAEHFNKELELKNVEL